MKKLIYCTAITLMLAGCTASEPLLIRVTPLGQEPAKVKEQYIYGLPQTVLKVEVTLREEQSIPGPYWEYAEKYLGLRDVVTKKSSHWSIWDVDILQHQELDPQQLYSLNVLEGEIDEEALRPYMEQGVVLKGTEIIQESVKGAGLQSTSRDNFIRYEDLGVNDNFEERTETMYKTIVTDTAFVEVPVQRTVVEQKSPATKAKEAADFLLELRTRRFEMLTGEYDVYPDGVAMGAALQKLDQMEASYLSLFTGKTITRVMKRTWFIVPEPGSAPSAYPLGNFSDNQGFISSEQLEGEPLKVEISPLGKTLRVAGYFSASTISDNAFLYRIPDLAEVKVMLGGDALSTYRITIFQSGQLATAPVHR